MKKTVLTPTQQKEDQNALGLPEYSPKELERNIIDLLDFIYPFSVLHSVRLFGTRERDGSDYGHEIDVILHVKKDAIDLLLLIEVKKQPVRLDKYDWKIEKEGKPKSVREQLNQHTKIIWEYLRPLSRQIELRMVRIVASSEILTRNQR